MSILARSKAQQAEESNEVLKHVSKPTTSITKAVNDVNGTGLSIQQIDDNGFPIINSKNAPLMVEANTSYMLKKNNITVRYNAISGDIEINIPGLTTTVDNKSEVSFNKALDICHVGGYSVSLDVFRRNILTIADMNVYNPFADWVTQRKWDGINRTDTYYSSIKTSGNPKMVKRGLLRFAMTMLAAGFNPEGIVGGGITIVLVGGQGLGKSWWCSRLVPKYLFKDGAINPDDKDSINTATSYLLFELAELDGVFRKADTAKLKAFLSRDLDRFRRPYAASDSTYARRTAFIATVNHKEFLVDETGNRRFWPLDIVSIEQLPDDDNWKQQLWAELYENHYLKGERWCLDSKEIAVLNKHNLDFVTSTPLEDKIFTTFDFDAKADKWTKWQTATQICEAANIVADTKSTKFVAATIRNHCIAIGMQVTEIERRTGKGRMLLTPPQRQNL